MVIAVLGAVALVAGSVQADRPVCRRGACSGHGTCIAEQQQPLCLCNEGFAAQGVECVPAHAPAWDRGRRADAIRARIVHIATDEGGRSWRQVGRDVHDYPGQLAQYLQPGELWCSDFVAWVYRVAGTPLSGGYEGGWMVNNNIALRTWFQQRHRWVGHGSADWASREPKPGDYIRLDTPSGAGHSGIVRYVAGDTLYSIEGNVGNHVRMRTHRDWRNIRRLDGFGRLPLD